VFRRVDDASLSNLDKFALLQSGESRPASA
jgi:hypothetical protein